MDTPVLRADTLNKTLVMNQGADSGPNGPLTILKQVSLTVPPAGSLAITGASGSGKSTLLGLLAGLDEPSSGSVELFGESLSGKTEDQRAALRLGRVGFVFQSFHLLEHLTALENVMLPLELAPHPASDLRARAEQALVEVGLKQRLHQPVVRLSGGEQQRVALARAFAIRPGLLFADEPTGNLDRATGHEVVERLFALQHDYQTSLVLVTHDETLAARCEHWYRLVDGRLEAVQP
ncbi:MAG TPA: ATP-binding cassette domain-containing protein [Thiolinea sp.]|nr:ATP-binding cassette domain-containing protein [Thiolinea sp.]